MVILTEGERNVNNAPHSIEIHPSRLIFDRFRRVWYTFQWLPYFHAVIGSGGMDVTAVRRA
jgi:hypothetical protein